ncbi:MAG: nicotinamide-nucleotide amidohydrolase family protein [Methylococcaceae bacterium]|nr:nicotinamide-nucleotide amidohydrolase family protein [Methylococcaceae bacterium]MCI0732546.1 nicotinamide-nucleotide amidohydrolase family protein [Methylococcaceae bacterium]
MNHVLYSLAEEIGRKLLDNRHKLVTAESCTGGWVAKCVTDVAGSSQWFERGFVTYSNQAKIELLGVSELDLVRYGAVSRETVRQMAAGALTRSMAQFAVAVSGIAGPDGETEDKPVGTVWFAWQLAGQDCETAVHHFPGDRRAVREHAVEIVFKGILSVYDSGSK